MRTIGAEVAAVPSFSEAAASAAVAEDSAAAAAEVAWAVAAEPVHGSERNGRASPVTNQFRWHH